MSTMNGWRSASYQYKGRHRDKRPSPTTRNRLESMCMSGSYLGGGFRSTAQTIMMHPRSWDGGSGPFEPSNPNNLQMVVMTGKPPLSVRTCLPAVYDVAPLRKATRLRRP